MSDLINIGAKAKQAANKLVKTDVNLINQALIMMADELVLQSDAIIKENSIDVLNAKEKGIDHVMLDRLTLTNDRIKDMAHNLKGVAILDSPLDKVIHSYKSLKGFEVNTISVPLGVIGIIYEARPNVTTEAMSLCLKSGNSTILRGSSSTLNSNLILIKIINEVGKKLGLPENFVQLVESTQHSDVNKLITMNEYIDVIIPRGGASLINNVVQNATVPIIETGTGNNFAYIEDSCDIDKAVEIIINGKAQRPTVCNALEKLLIHKNVHKLFYTKLNKALKEAKVSIRACEKTIDYFDDAILFTDEDYNLEYLDYIIGIKEVDSIDEAIELTNKYSTKHSNLILSNNYNNIKRYTNEIDAACVYVNVSTRFSDGTEFGLGAEIGVSTQKLHARGPMGLAALTSTKSIIQGDYEIR